jgi:signal transduction histidine kinase
MVRSRTRSELIIPLKIKGQVIGVLDVQSDRLNAFDDTDLAVLQSLAHQVSAAVENVQLYEQGQRAAVMEERSRLARDLHDAVTQTLFSASLIAEAVPASWEMDQQEGRQLLGELQQLTRGALAEMRTLLLELRPAALVETSLSDLLHQLAEAALGRAGVPVTTVVSGDCNLPSDVHVALYRIAQEALNNVIKHARASQAEVHLRCAAATDGTGREVELRIWDDGRGFDPQGIAPDHLGLGIMRERAEAIGAHLRIETRIGEGTEVSLTWKETANKGGATGR